MADQAEQLRLTHITTVPQSLAFLKGQVGFMQRRGFVVSAISSGGTLLDQFGSAENVSTSAVEMERRISPLKDVRATIRLILEFRETKPTIVHAHTPKGGLLGMISSIITRVPVRVYHMRGLPYMTANGLKRTLLLTTERISCALADRVICISNSLREVAIADRVCPSGKIVVLAGGSGNGVDAERQFNPSRFSREEIVDKRRELGIPKDSLVILFVG